MWLTSSLAFAWQTLVRQRLRTALSLLGVAVGALAIVSVVSTEQSWQEHVNKAFAGYKLNYIRVSVYGNFQGAKLRRTQFVDEDVTAIRRECPSVERVTGVASGYLYMPDVHAGRYRSRWAAVKGIDASYESVFPMRWSAGRMLSSDEFSRRKHACVISPHLAGTLFPKQRAIGKSIRVQGVALKVVGVAAEPSINPFARPAESDAVYFPSSAFREIFHGKPVLTISAWSHNPQAACREINTLLRRRIGGNEHMWYAACPLLARQIASGIRRDSQVIGFVAAFCALLLGAYGVGSLLYISIADSAREVGLRRALGAQRTWVSLEVLLAGLLIGLVGAGIGTAFSKLAAGIMATTATSLPTSLGNTLSSHGASGVQLAGAFAVHVSRQALLGGLLFPPFVCMTAAVEPALEVSNLNPARAIALGMVPNHRLRLGLAVSQVCIAVAVVALLPSLYEGIDQKDRQATARAFRPVISITPYHPFDRLTGDQKPEEWRRDTAPQFHKALLAPALQSRLLGTCPRLVAVEPSIWFQPSTVRASGKVLWPARGINVVGFNVAFVTPSHYPRETDGTADWAGCGRIKFGRFFSAEMVRRDGRICVLDTQAALSAFGKSNGVGQTVRVNGVPLRVVGTMGGGAVTGQWADVQLCYSGNIFLPLSAYRDLMPALLAGSTFRQTDPIGTSTALNAWAADEDHVAEASQDLRRALPKVLPGLGEHLYLSEPTYGTMGEYFALRKSAGKRSAFSAVMLLLIALIGLANMLLVSLGEIRRELGLYRALGAQKWQVMLPLVAEGGGLALVGSTSGILLAWLLSLPIRTYLFGGHIFSLSLFWAVAACLAMVVSALLVSLIPGLLATRVNPAEALRSE